MRKREKDRREIERERVGGDMGGVNLIGLVREKNIFQGMCQFFLLSIEIKLVTQFKKLKIVAEMLIEKIFIEKIVFSIHVFSFI